MKKIYLPALLFSFLLLSSCSKDIFKRYEKRIVGTWHISDIDRVGIGGNTNRLIFRGGTFTFRDDGSLTYISTSNTVYQGSWDIQNRRLGDDEVKSLFVTAVDYVDQEVLSEFYDDMYFVGTNHFKTWVESDFHSYVTHFRR